MAKHFDRLGWLEAELRQPGGSRVQFREQLDDIDRALVDAARELGVRIVPVTQAFLQGDAHAAGDATTASDEIDARCTLLEDACYVVLARQSPVAGDLRHVVAVLRSVADVQRSGHLLKHIATSLTWVHPPSMPTEIRDTVSRLGAVSGAIFAGAIEAWRSHDPLAANELADRDDEADLLQSYLLTELYTGEQSVEEAVSLALIARYYERLADHGVQMARQVAYFLTGQRPS